MRDSLDLPVSDCGLAFYQSDSGDVSAVIAHLLPNGASAEAARNRLARTWSHSTVFTVGPAVVLVVDADTTCGLQLQKAIGGVANH
jgi:hypothetical protein